MFLSKGSIKCIALNALRLLSILGCTFVLIANIVIIADNAKVLRSPNPTAHATTPRPANATIVEIEDCEYVGGSSSIPDQFSGVFRAFAFQTMIMLECLVLLLSEFDLPNWIFQKFIPILDVDHSLLALGFFEVAIAIQFLSHFLDPYPMVAGYFLLLAGVLNMCTYTVRPRHFRSRAYWLNKKGTLSKLEAGSTAGSEIGTASIFTEKERPQYGFGRQDADWNYISRPEAAAQSVPPPPHYSPPSRRYSPDNKRF